jgi:acyl CoA:acetate/3-ketoacid CoA transferase
LGPEGLVLVEVAPGVDTKKDITPVVGFVFKVSDEIKEMDARLFKPEPMGLKDSSSWK